MARELVRIEGLRELDRALAELPKATARNVLRRVLTKRARPIVETAKQLVPVDTGRLRDSIAVSPRLGTKAGNAEYAAAMRAGLGKEAAASALRDARRAAGGQGSFAEVYVGPGRLPHAHMVEFGTAKMAPRPYLRPAWDAHKDGILDGIKDDLWMEIQKSAARLARRRRGR
jgi:HK97 gp10 family phage protein